MHALTDITGFGLAATLELRGAKMTAVIDWDKVPFIKDVKDLAAEGYITGASRSQLGWLAGRPSPPDFSDVDRAPAPTQASGGLLSSCDRGSPTTLSRWFNREGFESAAVVGRMGQGAVGGCARAATRTVLNHSYPQSLMAWALMTLNCFSNLHVVVAG